jgi:flagellar motility protein MotE (MotC chaperone)
MYSLRLIPIVLIAATSLLGLKAIDLLSGGSYPVGAPTEAQAQTVALPPPQPLDTNAAPAPVNGAAPRAQPAAQPKRSWAQDMFGFPDVTGSVSNAKPPASAAANPPPSDPHAPAPPARSPAARLDGTPVSLDEKAQMGAGERAVLERLQERRQELETRNRELDIREGLLKAAEQRLEARIEELRQMEARFNATVQKKDEAEVARFKGLITMYEGMKAKEAARIFDRLDLRVLLDVASQIAPRRMSEIMAQMTPEAAERLTVELAARASTNGRSPSPNELPKIEGRPRT